MTVEAAETPELRALDERARQRQKRWLLLLLLIGLVAGLLGGIAASRFGHRQHAQHHHSPAGLMVALLVGAVILVVEVGAFSWLYRRRTGIFRPTLVMGLPRRTGARC